GQATLVAAERRIDLDLVGAELAEVFRALAELGDMNIVLDPAVRGTLTIRLNDLQVEEALRLVAYTTGVDYRIVGSTVIVVPSGAVGTSLEPLGIEKFSLTYARTTDVMGALGLVAAGARLEADERTNSIIACGSAEELRAIAEVLTMLDVPVQLPPEALVAQEGAASAASVVESLEIVRLEHAPAQAVADLLALVVPSGKIRVDSRTNALVMVVDEPSREKAMKIISEVDVAEATDDLDGPPILAPMPGGKDSALEKPIIEVEAVKVIKLALAPADKVREALEVVIDLSKVGIDLRTNSLIVKATPQEIDRLEGVVALLDVPVVTAEKPDAPTRPEENIHMLKLDHASAVSVQDVLAMIVPPAKMQVDERTNTIVIMADEDTHARAAELAHALDVSVPAEPENVGEEVNVEAIVLKHASPSPVRDGLAAVLPKESIIVDDRTSTLIIRGTPSQHERARQIVALLDVPVPSKEADGSDAEPQAEPEPSTEAMTNIRAFRLEEADPEAVREGLALVMPKASVHVDGRTKSVLVVGLPDELARAEKIVELLDQPSPGISEPDQEETEAAEVKVVCLVHAPAAAIRETVAPIMQDAKIAADERSNSLLIVAPPLVQRRVAEIVAALDIDIPRPEQATEPVVPQDPEVMRVVTLAHAQAAQVRETLAPIVPVSSITVDPRTNSLVMVTAQSRMDRALEVIAKLDVEAAAEFEEGTMEPEVEGAEVVRLEYASPAKVREAVAPMIPVSRIGVDERTGSLVIVGIASERARARALIEALDIEVIEPKQITEPISERDPEVTQVVELMHAPAAQMREALAPIVPISSITVDSRTNSLVIVALQPKMDKALEVIAKLDVEIAPVQEESPERKPFAEQPQVVTYRLAYADAESLRPALGLLVPSSEVQVDARTNTLLVKATPSAQRSVAELIASLDIQVEQPANSAHQLEVMRVFRLEHASPSEMTSLLGFVAPTVKAQPDDRTGSLIVLAPADTLPELEDIIQSLDLPPIEASAEPDPVVTRIYRLNYATPTDIEKALESFIEGTIGSDNRTSSVVVRAAQSEHVKVLELIDSLDSELPQVLIEARLEELTGDAAKRLGLDWTFSGLRFGENAFGQWVSVSMDFLANLTALEEEGHANLISRQHTFTVDGKTGKILIGDRIPVITQEVQDGQAVNRVEFINAGIELAITPKVSSDGTITATVKPVISSIVGWTPQNYPQIRTRELETIVTLKSGQTAVIGGLLHSDEIEGMAKIPLLGDIPLLGELFKTRTTTVSTTELVMLITAYRVNPGQRPSVGPALPGDSFPINVEDASGGEQ
ncbi:MAG: secretin N-terminal domain-containing protein, partial [Firmicutes bacterium]|nr:secretin N-terminal domain-containing protein [Bacillota bacterium]